MAKRKPAKKAKTKKHSSRRRVGAVALNAQSPLVMLGAVAAGYLLGDKINELVDKVTGTMNGKIVGAIEGGAGTALMMMKLGKKKTLVEVGIGGILAGSGVKRLLREFGVINGVGGYQSVPVLGRKVQKQMNGYGAVPVLGQYATARQQLNGVFNGYQVPAVPAGRSNVMGCAGSGSGLMTAAGSDMMN